MQLLQIVHGRRDAKLRTPNTLAALRALAIEGYVGDGDAERARRRLPVPPTAGAPAADRARPADARPAARPPRAHDARAFARPGRRRRLAERVRPHDRTRPIDPRAAVLPPAAGSVRGSGAHAQLAHGTDRAATEELLDGLGFTDPARSYDVLGRLVDPSHRIGKVLAHLFPVMAPSLALSPVPDSALVRLERVAEAIGAPGRRTRDRRPARRRPARRAPARARRRGEFVRLRPAGGRARRGSARCRTRSSAVPTDAAGELVDAIARDAGRELSPRGTGEALSAVAVRVVRDAVAAAEPDLPLAVIGMGKLGARELNVASDLDLLFVYEGEGLRRPEAREPGRRARAARHPRRRVGTRFGPAAGGTQRAARAFDRLIPGVLGALRRDVGVPVAAAEPARSRAIPTWDAASS